MGRIDYMALLDRILENPDEDIFSSKSNNKDEQLPKKSSKATHQELTPIGEGDMPF